ncbi:LacI family DNA-binding transcriptional regulator [Mumia sp. ZJ1417]|uniref:LacI family DNA-binding transcriptional regulator n=1 Tax=Mumia sp. ZJ1417 TaxID=2708082 RepID=UPI001AB031B2|nr:LacI family DNA-binding transcriptional regulator [Mumia sp. ZJ1417]
MAVTIRDVAKAAGVSPATVSFVLNETPTQSLRPETRERVRAAAAALGYTPHRIARALREGVSRLVVFIAGDLHGGSTASMISGLESELREFDHRLVVLHGPRDEDLLTALAPRAVLDYAVMDFADADLEGEGWVDGLARHASVQVDHLVDLGHRHLAIAYPAHGTGRLLEIRLHHIRTRLQAAGLPAPVELSVPDDRQEAAAGLTRLREQHPEVTAVAAYDDMTAIRVLAASTILGLRSPQDLAVIGFDESPFSSLWTPGLTTVRIDAEGYGRRAARLALGMPVGAWTHPPSQVVRRETT